MSEERPRVDREGIHIDREVAESVAIEEELDANVAGPYRFPSPRRRRLAAWVYLVAAAVTAFAFRDGWMVGLVFVLLAGWHFLAAWPLRVGEHEAMTTAAAAVDFTVGHASASIRFKGWRARPRWSVVMYSATEPPDKRGLVVVDAVDGELVETPYVETVATV